MKIRRVVVVLIAAALIALGIGTSVPVSLVLADPDSETLYISGVGDECNIDTETGCSACNSHYTCVDDHSPDDYTTMVTNSADLVELRDLYAVDDSGVGVGTINSVTVWIRALWAVDGGGHAHPAIKSGGVAQNGAEKTLTNSWTNYSHTWNTPPEGGDWTWAKIDALQAGVALYDIFGKNTSSCTMVWVVVDYTSIPDPPTDVDATDGDHTNKVVITWTKSTGATKYEVFRDEVGLGELGDVATFDDTGADAPTITAGTTVASDGTFTTYVSLSLSGTSANNGTTHTYKVKAGAVGGWSGYSGSNTGYRGVGSLTYQWQRSSGTDCSDFSNISGATSSTHNDTAAPAPTITKGTVTATDGTYTDKVRLDALGYSTSVGATRCYRCYLTATGTSPQYSATNTGYRGVGALNRQWQKSAGDSDASSDPYDYTGTPAPTITHGSITASDGTYIDKVALSNTGAQTNIGAGRYYRAKYTASGCTTQYTLGNRGYRSVGSLTYQWYRSAGDSDASYSVLSGATSSTHDDTTAPAPTITPGSTVATDGTYTDKIALSLSGTSANDGAGRYYKCYHTATGATPGYTGVNRGYRSVGILNYQWQRSAGDSDADYSNIGGATSSTYDDTNAPAPTITSGTAVATDGVHTDKVALSLSGTSSDDGDGRYYQCLLTATGAGGQTSGSNRGHRDSGSLGYQWQRSAGDSNASYSNISGATSSTYDDTAAPAGTITLGAASASDGVSKDHITLDLADESVSDGAGRYYQCLLTAPDAEGQTSDNDRGYRTTGSMTYQWWRSVADADASYSSLSGATTDPYNDTTAPTSGDGRWYYCKVCATGAATQSSTRDRGYRGASPTIITEDCSGFDKLWAIVNGYIYDEGPDAVTEVGFEYGMTTSYGANSTASGSWTTGDEFWDKLTLLTPATIYHYRAKAYNGFWGYGEDMTFSTSGSATLYEHLNTGGDGDSGAIYSAEWTAEQFTSDNASHTVTSVRVPLKRVGASPGIVTLSITHADSDNFSTGADMTYALLNGNAMTTDYVWYDFDVTDITFDCSSKYTIVVRAISGNATDYILWQKDSGGALANAVGSHSSDSGITWVSDSPADYLFEIWGAPVMSIEGANVFSGYIDTGDWLITIAYKNTFEPYYPTEDVSSYFYVQLLDDTTILAQVTCPMWRYRPGSIYISKNLADTLDWGSADYKVRLIGNFGDEPYTDYALTALDWKGTELMFLDKWVIAQANAIGDEEGTNLTVFIADKGEVLNAMGHTMFSIGIPNLNAVRPDLFEVVTRQPEPQTTDWAQVLQGETDWEARLGPQISKMLSNAGNIVGLEDEDGRGVGGFFIFVVFIIIVSLLAVKGHLVVGLFLGYPLLPAGAWLGVVDYAFLGVVTMLAAVIFVYKVWLIK